MKKIELLANAKINLHLDISGKKENGYHDIVSNMQSISLCDKIKVCYSESDEKVIRIFCDKEGIPTDSKNIAYKAADKLIDKGCVDIYIEKNIPSPAGLAGGSADAAAVIYGLCKLADLNKSDDEIMKIAASVGADVPFCLIGGNKNIRGIGDEISDGEDIGGKFVLVAIKGEGVSTPMAYGMLDKIYNNFADYVPRGYDLKREICEKALFNIFEEVIFDMRPNAKKIKEIITDCGGAALMSGSGPSVFGLFDSRDQSEKAKAALEAFGADTFACLFASRGIEEI